MVLLLFLCLAKPLYKSGLRIFGEGIDLTDKSNITRDNTIKSIFELLTKFHSLQIRCPPFSGKTSVAQLMELYINKCVPSARVASTSAASLTAQLPFSDLFLRDIGVDLHTFINDTTSPGFIILDEAQKSYYVDDYKTGDFWSLFKAKLPSNIHILLVCSYSEALSLPTSPVKFRPEQSIYLYARKVDIGGGKMIDIPGLTATEEEAKQLFVSNPIGNTLLTYD